jgi:hypothetical protein
MKLKWMGLILLVAAACAAWGESRRVSVKLERVAPQEAVRRLSEAAGVPLELAPPAPEGSLSFDWKDVTFAEALRQLCAKATLRVSRKAGGFVLSPSREAPAAPPLKRVGLFRKDAIEFYATAVSLTDERTLSFTGEDADTFDDVELALRIFAQLGEVETDQVAGIENVTAQDDLGTRLTFDRSRSSTQLYATRGFPDEWAGTLALSPPNPRARKIAWVQGDLMVYRKIAPLHVELPLPPTGRSLRAQAGDWLLVVSQYEEVHREPEDDDEGLPPLGARPQSAGPGMRLRVYRPRRSGMEVRGGGSVYPALIDSAGRAHTPVFSGGRGAGDGQLSLTDATLIYPRGSGPPYRLSWDFLQRSDPERLVTFRMTDIPLPPPAAAPRGGPAARPAAPLAPPAAPPDRRHPYFQAGGGALVTRVTLEGETTGEATVQIGLSLKTAGGWDAVRWVERDLDRSGAARVADLKPGVYRVRRVYRRRHGPNVMGAGRWVDETVEVAVTAGKESIPRPLRWVRER